MAQHYFFPQHHLEFYIHYDNVSPHLDTMVGKGIEEYCHGKRGVALAARSLLRYCTRVE